MVFRGDETFHDQQKEYSMKLDTNKLSVAVALMTLAAWVVCAALVAVAPQFSMAATQHMFHLPADTFDWNLTWTGFFVGGVIWPVVALAFTWCAAAMYNGLLGEAPAASTHPKRA